MPTMLHQNSDDQLDDLAWLACRYVMDELTVDERDEFERRLDADQDAREAVASAVELLEIAALAGAETRGASAPASGNSLAVREQSQVVSPSATSSAAPRRTSLRSILAISLSLGGLLAAGIWGANYAERTRLTPAPGTAPDEALALVWSQTRQPALYDDSLSDGVAAETESWLAEASDDAGSLNDEATPSERLAPTTPSWMTAAMRGLSNEEELPPDELDSSAIREL